MSPLVSVMVTIVLLNVALMWAMPRLTLRRALRFLLLATDANLPMNSRRTCGRQHRAVTRDHCRLAAHFLDALLAGDGLARALAGAGVGPGALAADRQTAAMPQAAIAADVLAAGRCSAGSGGAAGLRPCIRGRGWSPGGRSRRRSAPWPGAADRRWPARTAAAPVVGPMP